MAKRGERKALIVRLAVGAAQGLALYGCWYIDKHEIWPATNPYLFAPLCLLMGFVPLIVVQGYANARLRVLLLWAAIATGLIVGLDAYGVWQTRPEEVVKHFHPALPIVALILFLFFAHALIMGWAKDGRYASVFDFTMKQAVQLFVVAAFVGVFWGVLYLGAALFRMIHLDFFKTLIEKEWFWIPATTLAVAASLHVTDAHAFLVRGVRNLALAVLSWLLPLIVLIAAMFLVGLIFTGLQPLWDTRFAAGLLLNAAAVMVLLINTVYQDGETEPHLVQRWAGRIGAFVALVLVALAAYAVYLRVAQYGWTVERIFSATIVLVFLFAAIGYVVAAVRPGVWMGLLSRWNIASVLLGLAAILVLFTPIADPYRISVADQVKRLTSGKVTADKFDFSYLHWDAGRFGIDALKALTKSKAPAIAKAADTSLKSKDRHPEPDRPEHVAVTTVFPAGKTLPASFLKQDWRNISLPYGAMVCLGVSDGEGWNCRARIEDFNGDGKDDILLSLQVNNSAGEAALFIWKGNAWMYAAALQVCPGDDDAIMAGKAKPVPQIEPLSDIGIGGRRLQFNKQEVFTPRCP